MRGHDAKVYPIVDELGAAMVKEALWNLTSITDVRLEDEARFMENQINDLSSLL